MSFAAEVKNELAHIEADKKCCQLAEIAGFFMSILNSQITEQH